MVTTALVLCVVLNLMTLWIQVRSTREMKAAALRYHEELKALRSETW